MLYKRLGKGGRAALGRWLSIGLVLGAFAGCQGPDGNGAPNGTGAGGPAGNGSSSGSGGIYTGPIAISLTAEPAVKWDPTNGKTTVLVQYSVRGASEAPLSDKQFGTVMLVDEKALDSESLLDSSSEELAVDLHFAEVLDASYSMTQHNPPAFDTMKQAARDTYRDVVQAWAQRPGNASFRGIWFDEVINQTVDSQNTGRPWLPDDLLTIPTPQPGSATKMYSAAQRMAELLKGDYDKGIAAGERDHHVMLLFSDGADNYSWFNNASAETLLTTSTGASYVQYGMPATTLNDVTAAIRAHPRLTVHVIGLGSQINASELTQIAEAGGGVFLQNPSSEKLGDLFEQVMLEFTTIQTEGALMPLPPGDYTYTLRVVNGNGSASDEVSFRFHAGDPNAGVLP